MDSKPNASVSATAVPILKPAAAGREMRMSRLRARETDRDASGCPDDGDRDARHHPLRWVHLLGPFSKCFLKGSAHISDVDVGNAARHLGRVILTNPAPTLVGVRKEVILAAAGHAKARLERPAQNLGTPSLGRCRSGARELGVCDPTVKAPRRHVTRRRRPRGFPRSPLLRRSFRWSLCFLGHGHSRSALMGQHRHIPMRSSVRASTSQPIHVRPRVSCSRCRRVGRW